MKKFSSRNVKMLLLTIAALILVGFVTVRVSIKAEEKECLIEKNIYATAEDVSRALFNTFSLTAKEYYVERNDNILSLCTEEFDVWSCYVPSDFNGGPDPFEDLKYTESEKEISKGAYLDFEIARKLVIDFAVDSNNIDEDVKQKCLDVIQNKVELHLINIDDSEPEKSSAIMMTHNTDIYLNDNMPESYYNVHSFVHELVHVLSNVTNEGTKYEYGFYNTCNISEAITEIVALEILENTEVEIYFFGEIPYSNYFNDAFALIGKYDVLKAYFNSDYYDVIFEEANKDAFDLFYLSATYLDDENRENGNQYVIWQQISR